MTAPVHAPPTAAAPRPALAMSVALRKIRRAAFVAAFNGWTIGACMAISLIVTIYSFSVVGLLISAALAIVTVVEFRGRRRLLQFDPAACAMLGWNQFAFMSVIVAYCGWRLWEVYRQPELPIEYPGPFVSRADWDLVVELLGPILMITYIAIIVATILAQGGNAIYYFTRRRYVLAHLSERQRAAEIASPNSAV